MTKIIKNFASVDCVIKSQQIVSPNPEVEESIFLISVRKGCTVKHEIEEDYLIVSIDPGTNDAYLINHDSRARFPIRVPLDNLTEAIKDERLLVYDHQLDSRILKDESDMSLSFKNKAEERYKNILPLIQDLDATLRNAYGNKLFEVTAAAAGKHKDYIYNTFYSYLRNGCRKWGLGMPQGKEVSRKPKERKQCLKPGRIPRTPQGKVIEERDLQAFEWAKKQYQNRLAPSINQVVHDMWEKFYFVSRSKLSKAEQVRSGKVYDIVLMEPHERPTYDQFRHWLTKTSGGALAIRDKKRSNPTEYKANQAGRRGDAFVYATAPGQLYQLDETPFDEELVSVFDESRSQKIGKPTLYFVRDTFSWAIAGVYITTESPSYSTVKEALYNAIRSKGGFLSEINSPITEDEWLIKGAPQALLVDNAEFNNELSEGAVSDLPITIKFGRPGRGDDKGHVESMFHAFSSFFKGISKAHQTKSLRDIAKQVAREHACLTINELYIISSVFIRHYNNNCVMDNFPLSRKMSVDGVYPTPRQVFEWGMKYRPGGFISVPEEELYLRLLEKGEVSIGKRGIFLKKIRLRYNCQWIRDNGLQDKHKRANTVTSMPCRYFRRLLDVIFICTPDGLQVATLDARDQRFIGLSLSEISAQREAEVDLLKPFKKKEQDSLVTINAFLRNLVENAQKQKRKGGSMPNIATIKDNRKLESTFDIIRQCSRYVEALESQYLPADLPMPSLIDAKPVDYIEARKAVQELEEQTEFNKEEDDFYSGE